MKTLAAILYQHNSPLRLEEIEIPELNKGQVLVKIAVSGICRTQLNEIKGFKGIDKYLPHLLGHEGSGVVMETGPGITKVKKGDHVVITWIKSRGLEGGAVKYYLNGMIINSGSVSTFSKYGVISENRLVKIPKNLPFSEASLLGCAFVTGAGIVKSHSDGTKSSIIVIGCGGVGGAVVIGAGMLNYRKIIAVDIKPSALNYARRLGATHQILFDAKIIDEHLRKICPEGADLVVDATGNKIAMEKAIEFCQISGKVIIAGNLRQGEKISLDPFELIKGKTLMGTWGGETQPDIDIPLYIKAFRNKKINLSQMIGKIFKFSKINEAIRFLDQGKSYGRVLLDISS